MGHDEHHARVGIVGAGELALMLYEASLRLQIPIEVLGRDRRDPAVRAVPGALLGDPQHLGHLAALAERCDVVTFDREPVAPEVLRGLERRGVVLAPSAAVMEVALDKAVQHRCLSELALPLPPTIVARTASAVRGAAAAFGGPVVLTTASGGHDGRGAHRVDDAGAAEAWALDRVGPYLVQPVLALEAEVTVLVARGARGETAAYPVVRTVRRDGTCRVVHVPSGLVPELEAEARSIAVRIADGLGVVGVLAVQLLVVAGSLLVDEIAARPHHSGHLTQVATITSQFDNHLRAVSGLPLGSTDLVVPAAATADVVARHTGVRPDLQALAPDVSLRLHGEEPRPGRTLGHFTAVAPTVDEAVERARGAAAALTPELATRTVPVATGSGSDRDVVPAAVDVLDRPAVSRAGSDGPPSP